MKNKDKILQTAYKMIYKNGYEQTSVDQIIAKAGVSKSNFYYHFPCKEVLGLAVLEKRIENYVKNVLEPTLSNENLTPYNRLSSFYDQVIGLHENSNCRYGCPFGNLAIELSAKNNKFRLRLEEFFEYWRQRIEHCLAEGIKAGEFSDRFDSQIFSELILSHLHGAVLMSKTYKKINALEKGCKEIINLLKAA